MQNTMVRGGGNRNSGEKNEKGERKKEEKYINASFWAINFAPPAANLFVGEKN